MAFRSYMHWSIFTIFIAATLCMGAAAPASENKEGIRLETSSGVVEGQLVNTKWGPVVHFYGVPYAKQPQRFQHSEPILYATATTEEKEQKVPTSPAIAKEQEIEERQEQNKSQINKSGDTLSARHVYHHHYNPHIKVVLKNDDKKSESPAETNPTDDTPINTDYYQNHQPCPQPSHMIDFKHRGVPSSDKSLNENCLRLNIFMPAIADARQVNTTSTETYPILVWIPGDGFSFGDAMHYDGSALAAKGNIIVVVVNYRVGVFGFASTGDEEIPGNAGLSDILSALRWVHENGEEFHGNIRIVTLGGRFSGSMAISTLITSPRFMGTDEQEFPSLAQRIILHGGIATTPWVMDTNPLERVLTLMNLTNCFNNESGIAEGVQCLYDLPVQTLLDMSMRVPEMFRPVVDGEILTRDPEEAISDGILPPNVDFLIGDNNGAGSLCYQRHVYLNGDMLNKIKDNAITTEEFKILVQDDLKTFFGIDDEGLAAIVAHEYLNTPKGNSGSFRNLYTHFCGLLFLRVPTETTARSIGSSGRNIVYRYELDGQFETERGYTGYMVPKWLETAIGNEIIFLFPTQDHNMTEVEELIFNNMTTTYINFIRTGIPGSPELWTSFNETQKNYVIFTPSGMSLAAINYMDRDVEFWRDAFAKVISFYNKNSVIEFDTVANITVIDPYSTYKDPNSTKEECKDSTPPTVIACFVVVAGLLGVLITALLTIVIYGKCRETREWPQHCCWK